jgi:RNA polymerase sigma-70 factor, ECF subfamily
MPDPKRYEEFSELVRFSTSRIMSYIQALLLNWNDTEDLFQETCLVLWQKFDEFTPGTSFLNWALRIAQHKVLNFQKKQARRVVFGADLRGVLMEELAGRSEAAVAAEVTALSGCMERLAENDQRILKLCYVEGIPIRQIADALTRSPNSVQNSLHRIRSWLLECIQRELNRDQIPTAIDYDPIKNEVGS